MGNQQFKMCNFHNRPSLTSSSMASADSYRKIPNASVLIDENQWRNDDEKPTDDTPVRAVDDAVGKTAIKTERIYWRRFMSHLENENLSLKLDIEEIKQQTKDTEMELEKLKLVEIRNTAEIFALRAKLRRLKEDHREQPVDSPQANLSS